MLLKLSVKLSCAIIICALLAACNGGGHTMTPSLSDGALFNGSNSESSLVSSSIVHTGSFWEYSLPPGINPERIASGPGNSVWSVPCGGTAPASVYEMSPSGSVTAFAVPTSPPPPPPSVVAPAGDELLGVRTIVSLGCEISDVGGYFWVTEVAQYIYSFGTCMRSPFPPFYSCTVRRGAVRYIPWLDRATATGGFTRFYLPNALSSTWGDIAQANILGNPAGTMFWFSTGTVIASMSTSGVSGRSFSLPANWYALWLALGSDGDLYVKAHLAGTSSNAVLKYSTGGTPLGTFTLPIASNDTELLGSMVSGPDHNLWIADGGLQKIERMTTSGALTQFTDPASYADPYFITSVPGTADAASALWFTEGDTRANKIGRISTAGKFSEYLVPTANAGLGGIIPCSTSVCGIHGGAWFAENLANKIARFDFP